MLLGKRIDFPDGSYEVRGEVDGRYVVRVRNRKTNTEKYWVWTQEERDAFDKKNNNRADELERNAQIYERYLSGETPSAISRDFNISPTRVREICARKQRQERR